MICPNSSTRKWWSWDQTQASRHPLRSCPFIILHSIIWQILILGLLPASGYDWGGKAGHPDQKAPKLLWHLIHLWQVQWATKMRLGSWLRRQAGMGSRQWWCSDDDFTVGNSSPGGLLRRGQDLDAHETGWLRNHERSEKARNQVCSGQPK